MRARNRGFALALVLVVCAGIFALALASTAMSRAAQLEARLVRERVEGESRARSAAVLVLKGITALPKGSSSLDQLATSSVSGGGGSSGGGASSSPVGSNDSSDKKDSSKDPDLPDILKEMMGITEAQDIGKGAKAAAVASGNALVQGGGLTGMVSARTLSAITVIQNFGLPSRPVRVRVENAWYRVSLTDAGGLLNLNKVSDEQFQRYLAQQGVEPVRATAISRQLQDWRDSDSFVRELGAEEELYSRRGLSCRNADLTAPEELLYLPAMTRDIYERIRNDLCVSGDGKLCLLSASRPILLSIPGVTTSTVDPLVRARQAGGAVPKELLDAVLAQADKEAQKDLRIKPMGVFKVLVEPLVGDQAEDKSRAAATPANRSDVGVKFDGLAVVTEQGLQDLGLRPM